MTIAQRNLRVPGSPFFQPRSGDPRHASLPDAFVLALRQHDIPPSSCLLTVSVARQSMTLWRELEPLTYHPRRTFLISTSRFGIGQEMNTHKTPLGLHRIARKVGGGQPTGTVFRHRQVAGYTWQGHGDAKIAHRILWLEGLEPGWNRGGNVDTFRRYIYIHGCGDETTLGRPQSHGCIHLAAADLLPLYDLLPVGTLVWIAPR